MATNFDSDFSSFQRSKIHNQTLKDLVFRIKRSVEESKGDSIILSGPKKSGRTTICFEAFFEVSRIYPDSELTIMTLHPSYSKSNGFYALLKEFSGKSKKDEFQKISLNEQVSAFRRIIESSNYSKKDVSKQCCVVVLKNLDDFTRTRNQALPYTLLDISKDSLHTTIFVIGITSQLNIINEFEKRVKSRFSHCVLSAWSSLEHCVFTNYLQTARCLLIKKNASQWNKSINDIFDLSQTKEILFELFSFNNNIYFLEECMQLMNYRARRRKSNLHGSRMQIELPDLIDAVISVTCNHENSQKNPTSPSFKKLEDLSIFELLILTIAALIINTKCILSVSFSMLYDGKKPYIYIYIVVICWEAKLGNSILNIEKSVFLKATTNLLYYEVFMFDYSQNFESIATFDAFVYPVVSIAEISSYLLIRSSRLPQFLKIIAKSKTLII